MINKIENCLYCGQKMESVTAKKRFCSDKCRVYYSRDKISSNLADKPKKVEILAKAVETSKNEPKEGSIAWYLNNG
jgi:ribosomal protein L24E